MAVYDGIYAWVRNVLRDPLINVAESELDLQIGSVLRAALPSGITYAGLSPDDKERVDEAVGLRVAVRVHPSMTTGGISNALLSTNDGDTSRSFAKPDEMYASWLAQANQALAGASFGNGAGGGSRFGLNGPSRRRCQDRPYERYGGRY